MLANVFGRRAGLWVFIAFAAIGGFLGCEDDNPSDTGDPGTAGIATLTSTPTTVDTNATTTVRVLVLDGNDNPISGAVVSFSTDLGTIDFSGTTGSDGWAQVTFTAGGSTGTAHITAIYGADQSTVNITVVAGGGGGGGGGASGSPSAVILKSVERTSIGVSGTGQDETSELIFEVQDASGFPIGADSAVTLTFDFVASPGGGEYLWPTSVQTDEEGLASTTLNSGTASGVAKVCARISGSSPEIASHVVSVAIHGGPPDPAHFSVVVERTNIEGRILYGIEDDVTAFVYDQWGNPVPPGTAVYFSSTHGGITGSSVTNAIGQATATLYSAAPVPSCSDTGYAYVEARTVDQDDQTINAQTRVLFSGSTTIDNIVPGTATFTVADGGSEIMVFYIGDDCGNPLVGDTSVSITVVGPGTLVGDTNVLLADTQSVGATLFAVTLADDNGGDPDPPEAAFITVTVTSANGNASFGYSGTVD